jgi:alkylhydroperoxidase family enzyme
VEAVLEDWRSAPDPKLRATLGFLEKVTLRPSELTADDAAGLLDAGVTEQQIVDALHVCALFNAINRVADGLGFDVPSRRQFERGAKHLLEHGYARRGK